MSGPTILVYSPKPGESTTYAALLRRAVPELDVLDAATPEAAAASSSKAEILLGWKFPSGLIGSMPGLRWIHKISAGVEDVVDELRRNPSLMVSRTDGSAIAPRMIEYTLGAIYASTQQFRRAWALKRERVWQPYLVGRASGKVVGVAGLGDIGVEVAQALHRNGMRVIGWRRSEAPVPEGVEKVYRGLEELPAFAAHCDFLVSILPATDGTRRVFDAAVFAAMKKEAVFINIGRGHSVDEDALTDALENGVIAGAVLDVFEREPLPPESRLWDVDGLMMTPHVSGPLLPEDVISSFLENLARFRAGQPLLKLVDPGRGY